MIMLTFQNATAAHITRGRRDAMTYCGIDPLYPPEANRRDSTVEDVYFGKGLTPETKNPICANCLSLVREKASFQA
jgi:hypothetical protein